MDPISILLGLSGLLSAGGSIGGALVNKGKSPRDSTLETGGFGASADPVQGANALNSMIQLGLVSPTAFSTMSPTQQAMESALQLPEFMRKRQHWTIVMNGLREVMARGEDPLQWANSNWWFQENLKEIAGAIGMSVPQMLGAEQQWQSQSQKLMGELQPVADRIFGQRLDMQQQLADIGVGLGRLPTLDQLTELERTRQMGEINRLADERRSDVLRTANAANFNPGRAVGELELERTRNLRDVDLDALARASALLGASTGAEAGRVGVLQSILNPSFTTLPTTNNPAQIAALQADQGSRGALGTGIAQGANALASTGSLLGMMQFLRASGSGGPGAPQQGANPFTALLGLG